MTGEQYDGDWYAYQNKEYTNLNSTVVSDKTRKDWEFRDHMFASKAIANLKEFASQDAYFMTAVGFKLPHPVLHVPKTYYDMYEEQKDSLGRQADIERTFPRSAPLVSYHCGCDDEEAGDLEERDESERVEPAQETDRPHSTDEEEGP